MGFATEQAVMPCCRRAPQNVLLGRTIGTGKQSGLGDVSRDQLFARKSREQNTPRRCRDQIAPCESIQKDVDSGLKIFSKRLPRHSDVATRALIRYLPLELNGVLVFTQVDAMSYRADNSKLDADSAGLAFRVSKKLDDWDEAGRYLSWGAVATAIDAGDGWLRCEVDKDGSIVKPESTILNSVPEVREVGAPLIPRLSIPSPQDSGNADSGSFHANALGVLYTERSQRTMAAMRSEFKQRLSTEDRATKFNDKIMDTLLSVTVENKKAMQTPRVPRYHSHLRSEGLGRNLLKGSLRSTQGMLDLLD